MTVYDQGTQEEKKAILENEAKLRQGDPSVPMIVRHRSPESLALRA
jgi:hypothetical protein